MNHHHLKTLPRYFLDVKRGIKKFEIRKDDRLFSVGDILHLDEWQYDGGTEGSGFFTGRTLEVQVIYKINDPEYCKTGYCVLGITTEVEL